MPANKKYKSPTTFSFRAETSAWEDFTMALTLEKDTPTEFFTRAMEEYLVSRQSLLAAVRDAVKSNKKVNIG